MSNTGNDRSSMKCLNSSLLLLSLTFNSLATKSSKLEAILVKAANKENYEVDLEFICGLYKEDIRKEQLKMQLNVIASNLPNKQNAHDLHSVLHYLNELSDPTRILLCEVCTLALLVLVMPATNAVSE